MAIAFGRELGTQVSASSGNTLVITTSATAIVGDWIIVRIASDNLDASTPTFSAVDSAGNTYTQDVQAARQVAAAGVSGGLLSAPVTTQLTAGGTITITLSGSVAARAATAAAYTGVGGRRSSGFTAANGATTTASVANTTPVSGDLVIGMVAKEDNTAPSAYDSDTTNGSWSTGTNLINAAAGTANQRVEVSGQYKIVTGTGTQTYDTTHASAEAWVALIGVYTPGSDVRATAGAVNIALAPVGTDNKTIAAAGAVDLAISQASIAAPNPRLRVGLGNAASNSSGTTLVITTSGGASVGDLIVVRVAADNLSASTPTFSCVDSVGNTYTSQAFRGQNATAAAGVVSGILAAKCTVALPSSSTITVTLSGAVTCKAAQAHVYVGYQNLTSDAGQVASGSGTTATLSNVGTLFTNDLFIGATGIESYSGPTFDSDTTRGAWGTGEATYSANAGADNTQVSILSQHKIVTAHGTQSWATGFPSTDWAACGVIFRPTVTANIFETFESSDGALVLSGTVEAGGRHGNCLQVDTSVEQGGISLPSDLELATLTYGFAYRYTDAAGTQRHITQLRSDSDAVVHGLLAYTPSSGLLAYYRGGTSNLLTSTTITLTQNVWYYIEVQATLGDSPNGAVIVRVDGVDVLNATGLDTKNAGTKTVYDYLRLWAGVGSVTNQYDDFYLSPYGFLGDTYGSEAELDTDGAVAIALAVTGTAAHVATRDGAVGVSLGVAGTATKSVTVAGALGVTVGLVGAAPKSLTVNGALAIALSAADDLTKTGVTAGPTDIALLLAGLTGTVRPTAGALALALQLLGSTDRAISTAGALGITLVLDASMTSGEGSDGVLNLELGITGATIKTKTVTGPLALALAIAATDAKTVTRTGSLGVALSVVGMAQRLQVSAGALGVTLSLLATARKVAAPTGALSLLLNATGATETERFANGAVGVGLSVIGVNRRTKSSSGTLALTVGLGATSVHKLTPVVGGLALLLDIRGKTGFPGVSVCGVLSIFDLTAARIACDLTPRRTMLDLTDCRTVDEIPVDCEDVVVVV